MHLTKLFLVEFGWAHVPVHPMKGEELTAPAADLPKPEPEKQKKRLDAPWSSLWAVHLG